MASESESREAQIARYEQNLQWLKEQLGNLLTQRIRLEQRLEESKLKEEELLARQIELQQLLKQLMQ